MGSLSARLAFVGIAPLLLLGCLLTPGKFESSLRIDADRSFAFAYKGEVIAIDMGDSMSQGLTPTSDEAGAQEISVVQKDDAPSDADKKAALEAKRRAMAEALSKEKGYRSVRYVGDGKFLIDYAITGVLDHAFVYPFNVDAEIVLPFIAVEVRANDTVRVRAPAFANDKNNSAGPPGMGDAAQHLDGTFTLDTDAEIVSQNSEDGPARADGRSVIRWRATPLTKDAPLAVLRMTAG
jgi:hypothetical protein